MKSHICGSIISFEGEISRFSNNNCNFLLQIIAISGSCFLFCLLHAFQFFLTTPWGPEPNCEAPGLDAPIINKLLNALVNFRACGIIMSFEGEIGIGIIKHSITFYSLQMHDYYVSSQLIDTFFRFGIIPVFDVYVAKEVRDICMYGEIKGN